MAKRSLGLVSIEMGNVGGNGGMGTVLEKVGNTVVGSAQLTTEDDTTTDFNIEESSAVVESYISQEGATTFNWSSVDVSPYQLWKFFGGILAQFKTIASFGPPTGGSAYTNGQYNDVALTGGAGQGATADITIAGGSVTVVAIRNGGEGYAVGNTLSAAATDIGGTGTGFQVNIATISNPSATESTWEAPASKVVLTKSLRITSPKKFIVEIPKAQVTAKFNFSFTKDALSQIDMSAKVLLPDSPSVGPVKVRSTPV